MKSFDPITPTSRKIIFAAIGLVAFSFETPAAAVVLAQGSSATIAFQATTGTPSYDFVTLNLMFSSANPFGTQESLAYSTFDANNALLTSGTFSAGQSIYTSGLAGQLTLNAIVPFSASQALTNNSFTAFITATSGSFELIGATASFQHVFTAGTNQLGVQGTFVNSAVPEPATWAMMILGFGAMGLAIRRRQKTMLRV